MKNLEANDNMKSSQNTSKNLEVQSFLEEIMTVDDEKHSILEALRKIVFTHFKATKERIIYGGIMFSNEKDKDWGGIFPYKNHVSFEFTQGFKLNNPYNILEGAGKKRRHVKIKSFPDIEEKKVEFFIKEAGFLSDRK